MSFSKRRRNPARNWEKPKLFGRPCVGTWIPLQSGHSMRRLETQSVPVFSSEWRESAPRGGFEQKARGTADPPATLPKEGGGGTEELHVDGAHRANFYPKLSDHRESRTEEAGVAHGRTAGGFNRPAQGPLGIPHAEAATGLGDPCPTEQPGAAAHRREAGSGPAGGRGAAAARTARGPRRPGCDRRAEGGAGETRRGGPRPDPAHSRGPGRRWRAGRPPAPQ
ncbi:synaptonemal complex central element protein 1-like isoform X3 [Moschus berezovskii]|uniref:synaptonemal complex central element protein 1-like isoform X3 n=1 Tax=Moschus berezovskii TaxID=68408 RepID=UPI002444AA6E|nr:synaptonemal complex central element protein 1-like isoform X3 [Moschus berezovskii]